MEPSEFGFRLYVVIATATSTAVGQEAWAGLGWVLADEPVPRGLFVEHSGASEHVFVEKMRDQRMTKFVLWDDAAAPIGLALVTNDLSAVPWISPEFYAGMFPEHYRRDALYYFAALLIAEADQGMHHSYVLLAALADLVIGNDGIACFDCADATDRFLPALLKVMVEQRGSLECHKLGQQHYYGYVTRGFKAVRVSSERIDPDGEEC